MYYGNGKNSEWTKKSLATRKWGLVYFGGVRSSTAEKKCKFRIVLWSLSLFLKAFAIELAGVVLSCLNRQRVAFLTVRQARENKGIELYACVCLCGHNLPIWIFKSIHLLLLWIFWASKNRLLRPSFWNKINEKNFRIGWVSFYAGFWPI